MGFGLFNDNLFLLAHCFQVSRSRVWALDAGMTKLVTMYSGLLAEMVTFFRVELVQCTSIW